MMDIGEIRRQNMLYLIEGHYKTQSQFANTINKPASYISQIKRGEDKDGQRIAMGNDMARDIETALNLPFGWMDKQHNNMVNHGYVGGSIHQSINSSPTQDLRGQQLHIEDVLSIDFYPEADTAKNKQKLNITRQLLPTFSDNLTATVVSDDFMMPVTQEKAIVIADCYHDNSPIYNGKIYLMNMGNLLICRYLQLLSGGRVKIFSEKDQTGETLERAEFDKNYRIIGRIIWQGCWMG